MYRGESEQFNVFALKVTTIVNEILFLGTKGEATIVEKLLCYVPDKFLPLVITIEQSGDATEMPMVETTERLDLRSPQRGSVMKRWGSSAADHAS